MGFGCPDLPHETRPGRQAAHAGFKLMPELQRMPVRIVGMEHHEAVNRSPGIRFVTLDKPTGDEQKEKNKRNGRKEIITASGGSSHGQSCFPSAILRYSGIIVISREARNPVVKKSH